MHHPNFRLTFQSLRRARRFSWLFALLVGASPVLFGADADASGKAAAALAAANAPAGVSLGEAGAKRPTRDPATWVWNVPDPMPHVQHVAMRSPAMDRTVGYNVYLPSGYREDAAQRFPVIYFLHGVTGTEKTSAGMVGLVRGEIEAGRTVPAIWIFVNGGQFSSYFDWPTDNVKAETFMIRELIPDVDARFRTLARREGRSLCGWSMGGDGAMRLAMKYPDLFCAAASISGAFGMGGALSTTDNVFAWAREHAAQVRGRTALAFFIGTDDRLMAQHRRMVALLDELEIAYTAEVVPGIGHNLGHLSRAIGAEFVRAAGQGLHSSLRSGAK